MYAFVYVSQSSSSSTVEVIFVLQPPEWLVQTGTYHPKTSLTFELGVLGCLFVLQSIALLSMCRIHVFICLFVLFCVCCYNKMFQIGYFSEKIGFLSS